MWSPKLIRLFHTTAKSCLCASPVEKSPMAVLRKKTGFSFTSIKKALEMHQNDIELSEKWLNEQAQAMGWEKAYKLQGRTAKQGLIGLCIHENHSVLVEVNCETDFVSKNSEFKNFVRFATSGCMDVLKNTQTAGPITKVLLDGGQLNNLPTSDGRIMADHGALLMGSVSEKINLRRGFAWKVGKGVSVYGYAHPSGDVNDDIHVGRIAALIAIRPFLDGVEDMAPVAKELCQHIVAMNPKRIGNYETDKPIEKNPDEEKIPDEPCLIFQEYIVQQEHENEDGTPVTAGQILLETGLELVDFKRFECGEDFEVIENVQTCQ